MSLETDGGSSTDCASETQKSSRKSYSREVLLSISQLEICKKLPSEFNEPTLSELEDTSHGIQDRQRVPGSLPLQGFRRTDYSSSPPTRGDSSSYSRGNYGRWESRSSGWGDRDNDAQSDRDSDSGRRYGNQAQRTSQSSEHDGLLGSGSFPRPSAYGSGTSAPKVQASNNYQSNKTNEPYHPPRPYKAGPHPRKDTDAINDETFGSVECTSEDRVEEERRRRASFELMRKEQHKILQEKQKSKLEKHKTEDIIVQLEDNKEDRTVLEKNSEVDGMTTQPSANSDLGRTSFPSQNPPARPRVPPGFKTTVLDKNSGSNLSHSRMTEVGKSDTEESLLDVKAYAAPNGTVHSVERQSLQEISSSYKLERRSSHTSILKKNDQISNQSVRSDTSDRILGMEDHFNQRSTLLEAHEALHEPGIIEHSTQQSDRKFAKSSQDPSASILDKIFGNVIPINVGDSEAPVMNHDSKPNDMLGSKAIQSSKFAQWFMEEDRKTTEDSSSSRPNDLLALIVGGDKSRSQAFDGNVSKSFPSEFFDHSPEPTSKVTLHMPSTPLGLPEPMHDSSKREATLPILTCEDLEHKMLSEYSEKKPNLQPTSQVYGTNRLDTVEQPVNVDSNASQHLLSLLQKGPGLTNMEGKGSTGTDARDGHDEFTVRDRSKEETTRDSHAPGKAVTLETLFGSAFMKELQSVQAPVSIQKNSVGPGLIDDSETRKSSLPGFDDGLFSSIIDGIGPKEGGKDNRLLPLNYSDQTKLDKPQNWLGFGNSQYEVNSRLQSEMVSKSEAPEFHLPAENLFSARDHLNPQVSMVMPAGILSKGELTTGSVSGGDERSLMSLEGLPLSRVPYEQSEMPLHHRLAQPSSLQFHPLQMSQGRPLFHPMDSGPAHLNPQIFNGRESMALHEAPGRQFAGNMNRPPFHRPNGGMTGFDLPAHHPMLQQMQMAENNPHLLHDRLRGAQVPSHLSNQAANNMQEVNRVQAFPFVPHQVNISGHTVQMPDPDINSRNNHPEAMQRLAERQLGAPKQIHPFAGGNVQGMYNHELDMGLRYR
ncbi:uncharacterized protein [Solanum tuberosum]|uniref:uncharacterized protein isoform X1 n=1 Tax=Solanum tuberosum TaxID=4113 RepID=UPI0003D25E8F|nr:PREDICTED: uncharacterized protein LOC102599530 isoform X1 [Solanum tuberosum]KAH0721515.1 hypothetical protein KY284_006545 [Solanum tuberosum]